MKYDITIQTRSSEVTHENQSEMDKQSWIGMAKGSPYMKIVDIERLE